jgi:hypothetical protein
VHVAPQVIPAGLEATVPEPTVATLSVYVTVGAAANVAVTVVAAFIVTVHVPLPVHPPLQPPNTMPLAGVAVSVTTAPLV